MQACGACGKWRMPPRPMCPSCRSTDVKWDRTSGRGRIWSFIVPHPPLLPAYAEKAPYNAIIVELEEDPTIRYAGNLVVERGGRHQRDRSRDDHHRRAGRGRLPPDRRRQPPEVGQAVGVGYVAVWCWYRRAMRDRRSFRLRDARMISSRRWCDSVDVWPGCSRIFATTIGARRAAVMVGRCRTSLHTSLVSTSSGALRCSQVCPGRRRACWPGSIPRRLRR